MRVPLALFAILIALPAAAATAPVVMTLENHRFSPAEVTVPAGEKITIVLINKDAATEEFDSEELWVEKGVTPHGRIAFTVGPLRPGAYSFMGETHPRTAQGHVTAVAQAAGGR